MNETITWRPTMIKLFKRKAKAQFSVPSTKELIRRESEIGSLVFGPVPEGRKRQFYCIDSTTWVWYEEWTDDMGKLHQLTTTYEIRGNAVIKQQGEYDPQKLSGRELHNLLEAIRSYYIRVARYIYHQSFSS